MMMTSSGSSSNTNNQLGPLRQSILTEEEEEMEQVWQSISSNDTIDGTTKKKPFRSEEEMRHAQACFRQSQGYAYFIHMRKSGGTSMRSYLNLVAEEIKPQPHIYVSEGLTFNVSCKYYDFTDARHKSKKAYGISNFFIL